VRAQSCGRHRARAVGSPADAPETTPGLLGALTRLAGSLPRRGTRALSRAGCSRQFGRASAPMMPHRVQTMRGPTSAPPCGRANDRRSAPPHDGTASRALRATARRWRACCQASSARWARSRLLCHGRVGAVSPKTQFGVWSHLEAISTRIRAVSNRDGGYQRRIAISSICLRHRSDSPPGPSWPHAGEASSCGSQFLRGSLLTSLLVARNALYRISSTLFYTAAGPSPFKHPRRSTPPKPFPASRPWEPRRIDDIPPLPRALARRQDPRLRRPRRQRAPWPT
jgi:hypothetical protein